MDPLSITASVLAVLTASGKTLQGLGQIWELRHWHQEYQGICFSVNALRTLFAGIDIALRQIQEGLINIDRIRDCLGIIDGLCDQTVAVLSALDELIQDIRPRDMDGAMSGKPSRVKWIHHKARLLELSQRAAGVMHSLGATLHLLQGIQNSDIAAQTSRNVDLLSSRLALMMEKFRRPNNDDNSSLSSIESLDDVESWTAQINELAHVQNDDGLRLTTPEQIHTSSKDSIDTLTSTKEHFTYTSVSSTNLVSLDHSSFKTMTCQRVCQCQCHMTTLYQSPWWLKYLIGSITFHGNSSMVLKRRARDRSYCSRNGLLRAQVSYMAPSWTFLKSFSIYMKAEAIGGIPPSFNIFLPRIIPFSAPVWSIIELGKIRELRDLLSLRQTSPYDVDVTGTSLLKYAADKGQNDIISLLLDEKADAHMRDGSGMVAIQPGIDRALSGMALDRNASGTAQMSSDLFISDDSLDQQDFTDVHLIVLDFLQLDLEQTLKYHRRQEIDIPDSNGRTPLLWAAWRGDVRSLNLLIQYGADVDKSDQEGFTPLAKAAQAGHLETVQRLLKANASIHISTHWGYQPIHLASNNKSNGHEIVQELVKGGADPNAYSYGSGTPLHNAANRGSLETIKTLVTYGASIDAIGENGDTPAMVALYCWNETAFLHLAKEGARLGVTNRTGHNIVQLATWSASTKSWDLITEYVQRHGLGCIDFGTLHDGHSIEHCFNRCRELWFLGEREDERTERVKFDRMIQACKE